MLARPQRFARLLVNRARGRDPDDQPRRTSEPRQRLGGEQRLAPARRHLEADMRNRSPGVIEPADVTPRRQRDPADLLKCVPSRLGVIQNFNGNVRPDAAKRVGGDSGLDARLLQLGQPAAKGVQCGGLVFFEFHGLILALVVVRILVYNP